MKRLILNENYCKGCLICIEVCPVGAIQSSGQINSKGYILPLEKDMNLCTECLLCEVVCPDFAITIHAEKDTKSEEALNHEID
jgi:2-oxoglutarate ferredoxin oxidoreductase subunit delta